MLTPQQNDFWFLPLGGCGEIGMNLNLYGHDGQWLMIDCGITFGGDSLTTGKLKRDEIHLPDPAFIATQPEKLAGLIITHAHEDHMGAVPYLWDKLKCPIYATPFTAEMLRRKWIQHKPLEQLPLRVVQPNDSINIGVFTTEWITQNHSVPESSGILIKTPAARVFHSADWKLDEKPVIGSAVDVKRLQSFGSDGIDALVCDSTCANVNGDSTSESSLYEGLHELISNAEGRVVVACFGTNIARLKTLAMVAKATGRHLGLLGRSLKNTTSVAYDTGVWQHERDWVAQEHLGYLPRESVLLVATGSQAEPRSALNRMSQKRFKDMELVAGDTVILSARKIPGNEDSIDAMLERLLGLGVHIHTPDSTPLKIHASGHATKNDLVQMYDWLKPALLIPVHGESTHMQSQLQLARSANIQHQLLGKNGDLFNIAPSHSVRLAATSAGRLKLDPSGGLKSV